MALDTKPYCEYNCDYPCAPCLAIAQKAESKPAAPQVPYNIDDINDAWEEEWGSYTGGERTVYPITKFTETGYQQGYQQPPAPEFSVLQRKGIITAEEIMVIGPTSLKRRRITTLSSK